MRWQCGSSCTPEHTLSIWLEREKAGQRIIHDAQTQQELDAFSRKMYISFFVVWLRARGVAKGTI